MHLALHCISGLFISAEQAQWKAGAAKVVITPSEHVWMAGYAERSGPSDGALVDLFARCLLAEGGYEGTEAIIYQSLPSPFTQDIEERIIKAVRQLVVEPAN